MVLLKKLQKQKRWKFKVNKKNKKLSDKRN